MVKLHSGSVDRRIIAGIAILAIIISGLLYFGIKKSGEDRSNRPPLLIMSSISLQWGEVTMEQMAKGETQPAPLFNALAKKNQPVIIDDFQKLGRPGDTPLLMIQPRALAPRELVQLDGWLRNGGTAIIFADPALAWSSELPLGDQRRPLFTSLLNPLFGHWGVQLALPTDDAADMKDATVGTYRLTTKSAGIWVTAKNAKPSAKCTIRDDELIASCVIGKGKALLIADADVLHDEQWTDNVITSGTMAWLGAVITRLQNKQAITSELWESEGN